jgi:chaperonin GroEL
MSKTIVYDKEAREKMKSGIDKLADAVAVTLGPKGRAVVIEKEYGAPQVTFDGVTVAKEVDLEDKFEKLGADFIKQAAARTNDEVGDGTTTAVVLSRELIKRGEVAVNESGMNVIQLAEELKTVAGVVIEELNSSAEQIADDFQKVKEVASLSAKDSKIGELVATVMNKIGKDGVVTIDDSNTVNSSYEIVDGLRFDRGYVSPYMITNVDRMEATLNNPAVLIVNENISELPDLVKIVDSILQSGKRDLLLISDGIEGVALSTLIVNKLKGNLNVVAVTAPGFGDNRKDLLEDIAIICGANVISAAKGMSLKEAKVDDVGSAEKIIITDKTTTIIKGKGLTEKISERITQLKSALDTTEEEYLKTKLRERIGKLSGGVAVIKVGALTESAQKELKQRVEDAVFATKAAIEEGIVPGGGMALVRVSKSLLDRCSNGTDINSIATKIVAESIREPLAHIIRNCGLSFSDFENLGQTDDKWTGFNAFNNTICNLREAGVVDPVKVTKTAFMNAISVASTYLTIGSAMIINPEEKAKESE